MQPPGYLFENTAIPSRQQICKHFGKAQQRQHQLLCFRGTSGTKTGHSVIFISAAEGRAADVLHYRREQNPTGLWGEKKKVLPLFDAAMAKCNSAIAVRGRQFCLG